MKICTRYLMGTLLTVSVCATAHAEIYKWKDTQGEVHYSNTLPPQAAGYANTQLDKHGLVIKEKSAAPTAEQRAADAATQTRLESQQQTQTEQKRRDTALLNTYTSPAEIDLARDRNLEQTKLIITGTKSRLAPLLDKQAALIRQAGGHIPDKGALAKEYQDNARHISELQGMIARKNKELGTIQAKFAADKSHFIELTHNTPASTPAAPVGPSPGNTLSSTATPPLPGH